MNSVTDKHEMRELKGLVILTIIKNGNDEDHKRREIKFPEYSKQQETQL